MSERVRVLNDQGASQFGAWLSSARTGAKLKPPSFLLNDPRTSTALAGEATVEREPGGHPFANRYEFGIYLRDRLGELGKTAISRNAGLWNWLSLFYIDQLAPAAPDGGRKIFEQEIYILEAHFSFRKYYRHAIRTPWLVAHEHGEHSRVLLIPAGKATPGAGVLAHRGEITEQLAARQWILGSSTIIEGAARLYLDPQTGRPKRGAGGSDRGSPRRLALVIQQLELTYDLRDCSSEQFLKLLPPEFDRWKPGQAPTFSHQAPKANRIVAAVRRGLRIGPHSADGI